MDKSTPKMWERLPTESGKAYNAFNTFLQMPIVDKADPDNERSLFNVSVTLGYATSGHRSPASTIEKWSATHNWIKRSAAYDSYMMATAITVKEASLVSFQQDTIERTTTQVVALNEVIDRTLAVMLEGLKREDNPVVPEPLAIQRVASAVRLKDDLARRIAKMPTTFRTEAIEDEVDAEQVYIIGGS